MGEWCWEIVGDGGHGDRGCRACPAYLTGTDCWEVEGTPCSCNPAVCILIECPVYLAHKEEIEGRLADEELETMLLAVRRVATAQCWEIEQCTEAVRTSCPAHTDGQRCWELSEPCPCSGEDGFSRCLVCPIRVFHQRNASASALGF
ncbi:MAG: hypothetical protein ACYCX3_15165 [Thermoleophilia bacterium]